MNTVMDDNKMLTLASNERIPLTPSMRLLLEINHMNHCSPATVSRGGVIFVNADDVGWKPGVDSWIEKLEAAEYRPLLTTLFSRYVDPCLDHCRRNFKTVVPIPAVSQVRNGTSRVVDANELPSFRRDFNCPGVHFWSAVAVGMAVAGIAIVL